MCKGNVGCVAAVQSRATRRGLRLTPVIFP